MAQTHTNGLVFDFVCGDEAYGSSPDLRRYCEQEQQGYVLRVPSNFPLVLRDQAGATGKQIVGTHLKQKKRWADPLGRGR